jgi:hypothetical protein
MVLRLAEATVTEPNDLEEIRFRYRRIPGEDDFLATQQEARATGRL